MAKLKVKVKEAVLFNDETFVLDVSLKAFAKNPDKEYKVPDKPFWRDRTSGDNPILILIGQEQDEPKSKPKEVNKDEKV